MAPPDNLQRLAPHRADDVVLADAGRHLGAGGEERHRIAADHDHGRHRLAAREILVAVHPPVLAGRDVVADGLLVLHHHPVGAEIHPAGVGVDRHVVAAGADIVPAVLGVPERRGELAEIHVVALEHVLGDRPAFDLLIGDRGQILELGVVIGLAELDLGEVGREAERHVLAPAAEEVDQHAVARLVPRDVVEDDAVGFVRVHDELGRLADLLFLAEPLRDGDLAQLLGLGQPLAQIGIGQNRPQIAARHGYRFARSLGHVRLLGCRWNASGWKGL